MKNLLIGILALGSISAFSPAMAANKCSLRYNHGFIPNLNSMPRYSDLSLGMNFSGIPTYTGSISLERCIEIGRNVKTFTDLENKLTLKFKFKSERESASGNL